jgi:hypothetical protein
MTLCRTYLARAPPVGAICRSARERSVKARPRTPQTTFAFTTVASLIVAHQRATE